MTSFGFSFNFTASAASPIISLACAPTIITPCNMPFSSKTLMNQRVSPKQLAFALATIGNSLEFPSHFPTIATSGYVKTQYGITE